MQKITAELLGSGRILLDGKQVNLPFKQAEALVYYLLVEKETFRPKLADIIWGDSADEHKVQSNMRNAIYVIRREFGRDFLVGASKNVIQINPEIRIDLDIDRFNDKNLTDFSFYAGDFLENFYLKDNEYYNEWLLNNRQHYRGLLQERLKESIVAAFQDERYKDCELECQKLMALDEFDEFGYVYLIEIYRARGEYSSAVALYDRLEKLLSEELFQSPSEEITALVQNIRQERNKSVLHVLSHHLAGERKGQRPVHGPRGGAREARRRHPAIFRGPRRDQPCRDRRGRHRQDAALSNGALLTGENAGGDLSDLLLPRRGELRLKALAEHLRAAGARP